jgi:hypothetical protein
MRVTAMPLLAVWIILNAVLAFVARVKPLVSAVFAGAAITMAAGQALRSPALADVGLAASLVGPVLYGALVVARRPIGPRPRHRRAARVQRVRYRPASDCYPAAGGRRPGRGHPTAGGRQGTRQPATASPRPEPPQRLAQPKNLDRSSTHRCSGPGSPGVLTTPERAKPAFSSARTDLVLATSGRATTCRAAGWADRTMSRT